MKLITCCSFKGGAGKTTALMGLCSSFAFKDNKVALFEADENRPLTKWKENALRNGTWDPQCDVFVADELPLLETAYAQAEASGFHYALADTRGGLSELNVSIIASSDFILVPTMLTPLDLDEALTTYRYVVELLIQEKLQIKTAILRQRVPTGRLTVSQQDAQDMLAALPMIDAPMYERDAFAAMKARGMLHLTVPNMSRAPAMRRRSHTQRAMDELSSIGILIEKALED
ncbi:MULTISPECIES: conjugal transfer ATPase VirC1 [unclassified Bradyrhizobium]|uniref:conjugal transfer ATPase VirC1 n=1 Tax=unclassified Bradyrhizobium TaxID=2631580 RepID=UPI001028AC79|nr:MULTISPECIES: conjugal transfer ATPase VirC1 [unclassified Bradyrhizobium]RZN11169.1 virulence protein [Bradyrhizobium sp. Leo121]TAI59831.1 virulence protein [Bradyrhizobium sp. Leo170]